MQSVNYPPVDFRLLTMLFKFLIFTKIILIKAEKKEIQRQLRKMFWIMNVKNRDNKAYLWLWIGRVLCGCKVVLSFFELQ